MADVTSEGSVQTALLITDYACHQCHVGNHGVANLFASMECNQTDELKEKHILTCETQNYVFRLFLS